MEKPPVKFVQISVLPIEKERNPDFSGFGILFALDSEGNVWWSNISNISEKWQRYSSPEEN